MGITQRYAILASGRRATEFHFLVAKVEKFFDNKLIEAEKAAQIPIKNGSGYYDCSHRQMIGINQPNDDLKSITCKFTPIGVIQVDSIGFASAPPQ